jgi:hypothetical protein
MTDRHAPPHAAADPRAIPTVALLLGAGGVLPFALLATAALLGLEWKFGFAPGLARTGLVAYGAVVLSFLGGVRWGLALRHDAEQQGGLLAVSVLPAGAAWLALMLPRPHDLSLLVACFLALAVADIAMVRRGQAPAWYATLRLVLTTAVVLVLVVALAFLPFASE